MSKVKEVSTPKFYFFDCGIVEALSGNLGESLGERSGHLFETLVLNKLKSYSDNFFKKSKGLIYLKSDFPGYHFYCLYKDPVTKEIEGIRCINWNDCLKEIIGE